MTRSLPVLVALLLAAAAAAAPTVLEAGRNGLVTIVLPDGTRAEMYPVVEGLKWSYSDYLDGEVVKGSPADLYGEGLTVSVPVKGPVAGKLEVFCRLQVEPADPCLVRFTYRFSAAVPTQLNCARLTFRLPIREYAGQPVASIEGPATPPVMPLEPLQGGHLLNASARGAVVAEGQPRSLRVELEAPRWCLVDDLRRWTGDDEYSLQFCALVSAGGTTLAPGQPAEVKGTVRFSSAVKLRAASGAAVAPMDLHAATADTSNPWFPRLLNAAGQTLLAADLGQMGQPEFMHPEPEAASQPQGPPQPGGATAVTARLYANARREAYLLLRRTISTEPRCLRLTDELTAHGEITSYGVVNHFTLAREFGQAGAVVLYLNDAQHQIPISDPLAPAASPWETAEGLRLQTAKGELLLELRGDTPRTWGAWPGNRRVTLMEYLVGATGPAIPDGTVAKHTLTVRW